MIVPVNKNPNYLSYLPCRSEEASFIVCSMFDRGEISLPLMELEWDLSAPHALSNTIFLWVCVIYLYTYDCLAGWAINNPR